MCVQECVVGHASSSVLLCELDTHTPGGAVILGELDTHTPGGAVILGELDTHTPGGAARKETSEALWMRRG